MKKMFFLACWLCSFTISGTSKANGLRFCYDPYPPYTLGVVGNAQGGLKAKLLEEVVARIEGVTATVELLPWRRCQEEARVGRMDGILPAFPSGERAKYLAFTDATFNQSSVFWYDKKRFSGGLSWAGPGDNGLSTMKLGMLNGSILDAAMETAFESRQGIARASDVESLFRMLEHGRIDLVAIDAAVGRHHVKQEGLSGRVVSVSTPISIRTSHFGLSKTNGSDRYLNAFNKALSELRAAGRLEAILHGAN